MMPGSAEVVVLLQAVLRRGWGRVGWSVLVAGGGVGDGGEVVEAGRLGQLQGVQDGALVGGGLAALGDGAVAGGQGDQVHPV